MNIEKSNITIGFIGIGVMGKSMAGHLLKAGYNLHIYTRTKDKATDLITQGAVWKNSVTELAKQANVIITMIGYPQDVESIYLGSNGIISNANKGTYLIDMTTSTPTLAQKIAQIAKEKDMFSLDAPVSGGDIGAREARLTIMVGGESQAFEVCKPILEKLGVNITLQGEAGAGQHTKMCNQIAIATNMIGICESVAYAQTAGLDPEKVLQSISAGAAGSWSLSNLAPRIIKEDFEPGFFVKHFIKDMGIALEEASSMGMEMPGLELAKKLYDKLANQGEEDRGTQALYKLWEQKT
ncbi:NAD(P)-dependent oxidoreductase [Chengkuizengella sediminis]|uniref:NAD(P)-dependent oxidoreductase n=1 Tax=Chengkuizengella sediminis TaxID=1885917 RepID=UPI001389D662|nr:NAD(P)-dependent oxidoreductase [Chengkuizengella sediminis]NDI35543.1 NAD(P)-dependent oxidoreductase [Chengkuizengella sediminis]